MKKEYLAPTLDTVLFASEKNVMDDNSSTEKGDYGDWFGTNGIRNGSGTRVR